MRLFVPCPHLRASVLSSYYILDRRTAPSDRTAPKFGTHVRIVSLTLKKKFDPPHPGGWLCGWQLYTFHLLISGHDRRTEPKFGSHVRIDTPTLKKIDPPRGGFRGLYIVKNLSRRIAPKFRTHVRIDTLPLKKIKMLTHPTPGGGFRGLYIVKNLSRRIAPKFGTHVQIDTLTLKK